MSIDPIKEINYEQIRSGFLKYTRKAFAILPKLKNPRILDIGCGNGIPSIELAKLCNGEIIGIDIDQSALDEVNKKAKELGLNDRIKTINCSMFDLNFPDDCFDIVWAEGAIAPIGFERGLKEWGRILKKNGFMVLHDDLEGKKSKLNIITKLEYKLIDYFQLPDDEWWVNYYKPLEKRICELLDKYKHNQAFLDGIKNFQNEINACKKNPMCFRSIFYIIKKV